MSELLADLLITVLFGTQASFTHPGIILPAKESLGDTELKSIVRKSQRVKEARDVLGFSPRVWRALTETLRSGNDQLLGNKHHLLAKIADLASLGRNLLVAKERAQDLSSEHGFEAEIRKLVEICIDKASKPISPNLDKTHHEKEMKVKQAYKRVLITSLQFLNNLISGNETRKLHLWIHLFGSPMDPMEVDPDDKDEELEGVTKQVEQQTISQPSSGSPQSATKENNTRCPPKQQQPQAAIYPDPHLGLSPRVYHGFAELSSTFNYSYYSPGLLTDIPRILGPQEIEALPMIVQTGVAPIEGADKDMQAVRCNILLAQESGRELLKELLVFIGAWEVEERDFCYKMMQSIMEAILLNGLVPFAYEAFKDEKDVITPAQCVILKLLVSIYRAPLSTAAMPDPLKPSKVIPSVTIIPLRLKNRQLVSSRLEYSLPPSPGNQCPPKTCSPPHLLDTSIAAYFIRVFRQSVLPSIRRIILQQGAIKNGEIKREDFEWSLWDLDRVYEGLYQFMDLMVIFAEDDTSKPLIVGDIKTDPNGGLVGELVRFLIEMDRIIPKYVQMKSQPQTGPTNVSGTTENQKPGVGIVERPYDALPEQSSEQSHQQDDDTTSMMSEMYEGEGDEEEGDTTLTEPEEFTWPHMKKFVVLLISNLAWKNHEVKELVRESGGLDAILNQCSIDDDNPYIREYAVLCIKNLLEGNLENQRIVAGLEAKKAVTPEVLIKVGYEAYIDERGKVGLKRVQAASPK